VGYWQHLRKPGVKDINCDTCSPEKRRSKCERGFDFPTPGGGRHIDDCPKAFLFGCPIADKGPQEPRLFEAIEAFNFYNNGCFWCDGGFIEQPRWYRHLMSYMDSAHAEEMRRQQEADKPKPPKPEDYPGMPKRRIF
jgi:hypothetical protein